jgi:GT2 family glycosyltransferase/glycosyltransferase involved in cell wall biosynthesis
LTGHNNRKPFIAIFPADMAGCGHARMIRPAVALEQAGMANIVMTPNLANIDQMRAMAPDVLVFQRPNSPELAETIGKLRAALPDTFFVYEIDDAFGLVPDDSVHSTFIHSQTDAHMATIMHLCDVVTTTTKALAARIREFAGEDLQVRVIPNMIFQEEFDKLTTVRKQARATKGKKLRIGWAGGIGHIPDLKLITPAINQIGNAVEWVFMALRPDGVDPALIEYHDAVSTKDYPAKLASLGLDVLLAPLVDNGFNRCKSNLKLLDAAALGIPAVASSVTPYTEGQPPLIASVGPSAVEWTDTLVRLAAMTPEQCQDHARHLRKWAQDYIYETNIKELAAAWLPVGPAFKRVTSNIKPVEFVLCSSGIDPFAAGKWADSVGAVSVHPDIESAAQDARDRRCAMLWVRFGSMLSSVHAEKMIEAVKKDGGKTASYSAMSNLGTGVAIPKAGQFNQTSPAAAAWMTKFSLSTFKPPELHELLQPSGSFVWLTAEALAEIGVPQVARAEEEVGVDAALMDWSISARKSGYRHYAVPWIYVQSIVPITPNRDAMVAALNRAQMRWRDLTKAQLPDTLKAVRRTAERGYLVDFYKGPPPQAKSPEQVYDQWTLTFDTAHGFPDAPNVHVFENEATHQELASLPDDDWVCIVPHGVDLAEHATALIAAFAEDDDDMIFGDEDRILGGRRCDHWFKGGYDRTLLMQQDYITNAAFVRVRRLLELGDDHPITRRDIFEIAVSKINVRHIQRVLAHVTEDHVPLMAEERMATALSGLGSQGTTLTTLTARPHQAHWIDVSLTPVESPLVSIIIPTKDKIELIEPCIKSLISNTAYKNYEIIVVDTGSTDQAAIEYERRLAADGTIRLMHYNEPFNWSAVNNFGVQEARGDIFLFLNNDVTFHNPAWLGEMVAHAMSSPDIGAVGARLIFPNGTIQHVGVMFDQAVCGHIHKNMPAHSPGYHGIAALNHESDAVTGAVMMVRRNAYKAAGGFNEDFVMNYSDVAFCLALQDVGYRNIVVAKADIVHHESATRPAANSPEGRRLLEREGNLLKDLCGHHRAKHWNRNLYVGLDPSGTQIYGMNCEIPVWAPEPFPWDDCIRKIVLVVNGATLDNAELTRRGMICVHAFLKESVISVIQPSLYNEEAWDIRKPETKAEIIGFCRTIGIEEIIFCGLNGQSDVSALNFLSRLGAPITYWPRSIEALCPRGTGTYPNGDGKPHRCDKGWLTGACEACVEQHGTPQGYIDPDNWRAAWRKFMRTAEFNPSHLADHAPDVTEWVNAPRS